MATPIQRAAERDRAVAISELAGLIATAQDTLSVLQAGKLPKPSDVRKLATSAVYVIEHVAALEALADLGEG